VLLIPGVAKRVLDHPNRRSLHSSPVPRTGGIAIAVGCATALFFPPSHAGLTAVGVGAALLFLAGLIDDLRGMGPMLRLIAQLAAAGILLAPFCTANDVILVCAALVVATVWIINLYNFMDGSDGLAGGMTVIGFGAYAIAAAMAGDAQLAAACGAVAAAAAAFLIYNFHPARIFLGDCGSVPLGFLAAGFGVVGLDRGHWSMVFVLLAFAPFIADASLTLARRVFRRERIWEAHRDHYYQRLVRMGLGHRGTALLAYGFMLGTAATALATRQLPLVAQVAMLGGWAVAFLLLAAFADHRWERFRSSARSDEA
jgi:UDP-N-acetylmuramyl pentapeptide phosphotransferase/UDP-N-acetylglucosamine-1-phosphate transferase